MDSFLRSPFGQSFQSTWESVTEKISQLKNNAESTGKII